MIFKVLAAASAYFIGNISPAISVSRLMGEDIRAKGSGNAGTTNMLRIYGKKAAALTLLIDVLKGVAAVLIGRAVGGEKLSYICALAVEMGHIWPVCWDFKGGKGIATGLGVILAISPLYGLSELAIAAAAFAAFRMVSPGSLAAAAALPLLALRFAPDFFPYACALAIMVVWMHRSNIVRLARGEERRISFRREPK